MNDSARLDGFYVVAGNANGTGPELFLENVGGGILVEWATPVIQNTVFFDNDAIAGGGGHAEGRCDMGSIPPVPHAHPMFVSCAFVMNRASSHGAYCNRLDSTTFINCLFNGNQAEDTGTITTTGGGTACAKTINLINCTVTQNSAGGGFGGINNGGGTVNLHNSIVWGNTAPNYASGGTNPVNNITYSDVQGTLQPGTGNTNIDPLFIDDDGGDNVAGNLDDNLRLSHLTPTPVRNGALATIPDDDYDVDDDADLNEATPDRDRKPRVLGTAADMGAFERYETGTCPDVNGDGVVDVDDLIGVILGWGPCPTPPALCQANVETAGTSATTVDVDDLVAVILAWGPCPDNEGMIAGSIPETYEDCEDMCSSYSGDAWANCMQRCFQSLCLQGHDEFCED